MDGREVIVAGVGLGHLAIKPVGDFLDGSGFAAQGIGDKGFGDAAEPVFVGAIDLGEGLAEFGLEMAWFTGAVRVCDLACYEGHYLIRAQ